jgi:glucose uptake protein GlcU
MYYVLLHLYVSSFYLIIFHLDIQTFIISHAMGLIVVAIRLNYIGHNNTYLDSVTFLMMSCVNLLFDN